MQGQGLRFADFNQAKFTVQLGPFRTHAEADLEKSLWKLAKMVSIWSYTKCNHHEHQEIMSKWAPCSVPQCSCFPISKTSDLFLLQPSGWETHDAQNICSSGYSTLTLGNTWHSLPREVTFTQAGLKLYLGLSLISAKKLKYAGKPNCCSCALRMTVLFPNIFSVLWDFYIHFFLLSFCARSTNVKPSLNLLMNTPVGLINYCKIYLWWRSWRGPLQTASLFTDKLPTRYCNNFCKRLFLFASSVTSLSLSNPVLQTSTDSLSSSSSFLPFQSIFQQRI